MVGRRPYRYSAGDIVGELEIIEPITVASKSGYNVKCKFGVIHFVQTGALKKQYTCSCTKNEKFRKTMVGVVFGNLSVISYAGSLNGRAVYDCVCTCGMAIQNVRGDKLRDGRIKSCGCLNNENIERHASRFVDDLLYSEAARYVDNLEYSGATDDDTKA